MRPSHHWLLLALLLVLSTWMSGCNTALPSPAKLSGENEIATFYLESSSDTSGGFLSLDPQAGASNALRPAEFNTNPASAAQRTAGASAPTSVTFRANAPLAHDHYLNVSRSISGVIYLATQAAQTAGHDHTVYRFELFVDDRRVFGSQNMTDLVTAYGASLPMGINQRAEVLLLPKGSTLSFKVTRIGGLSDLSIGTGGSQQSYVAFSYFRENPLSGAVYVERGTLLVGGGTAEIAENRHLAGQGSGPIFIDEPVRGSPVALAWLAGIGLVSFGVAKLGRGRLAVALVLLCLLGPVMAGCLGGSKKTSETEATSGPELTKSTAEYRIVDREGLGNGTGALEGTVQDRLGLPVPKAHVSLLGTIHTTQSNEAGRFGFANLTAGAYTVRVDAQNYLSVEKRLDVVAGRLTEANVTLVRIVRGSDIHSHDYWGDDVERVVMDADVTLASYTVDSTADRSLCPGALRCETLVMLQEGQSVLPGTTRVEVTLSGTAPTTGPQEFELRVVTGGNLTPTQRFGPRKLGDPFNVAIFPNEADPGHQRASRWQFFVSQFSQSHLFDAMASPLNVANRIHMTVKIHKGVVPYEPVHQDFWQGRSEVVVVAARTLSPTHTNLDYPADQASWVPDTGAFVPPGTKEIRGSLTWTHPQGAPAGTTWSLSYRAADMSPASGWRKAGTITPGTNRLDFVLQPKAEEVDQFYQSVSYWRFSPDDQQAALPGTTLGLNSGYTTRFTLTATAIRDPNWVETAT